MSISSEVTYGAGSPTMAQDLSAAEDRATTDVGRGAMPESLPSFETSGYDPALEREAMAQQDLFQQKAFGIHEPLMQQNPADRALLIAAGVPFPQVWYPPKYGSTVASYKNTPWIGYNAAEQPGTPPGLQGLGGCGCGGTSLGGCGCRFQGFAGLASDDDLDFDLHTTETWNDGGERLASLFDAPGLDGVLSSVGIDEFVCLGGARSSDGLSGPDADENMQTVIAAAGKPFTELNRQVVLKLLDQADKLSEKAEKRSAVAQKSRKDRAQQLMKAGVMDKRSVRLLDRIYGADQDVRPDASVSDVKALRAARKEGFKAARQSVRDAKLNVVATALTANAAGQAELLTNLARAVGGGEVLLASTLASEFQAIGKNTAALKNKRREQKAKWSKNKELQGLHGLNDPIAKAMLDTNWHEADLVGQELGEMAYLEDIEGWLRSKIKSAAKKVGGAVKSVAKKTASVVKKVATPVVKKVAEATKTVAKKIANSKVVKNTIKVVKPIAQGIKKAAKVAIVSPIKFQVKAGRALARGGPRAAWKSLKSSAKEVGKDVVSIGTNLVGGVGCALANTRLVGEVVKGAGQAVGTVYGGGTVGGAVGRETANQAHKVNQKMCGAMKQLGLTGGNINLKMKNIRRAGNDLRKGLKKQFSKEEMLKAALRIAGGMLPGAGSAASGAITSIGTNLTKKAALDLVKNQARKLGARGLSRLANKVVPGRAGQILGAAAQAAASSGKVDADTLRRIARTQGEAVARRFARTQGQRLAQRALGRRAGAFVTQAATAAARGRLDPRQLTAQRAMAFARQQAMSRGTQSAAARALLGRRRAAQFTRATRAAQMLSSEQRRAQLLAQARRSVPTTRPAAKAFAMRQARSVAQRSAPAATNLFARQIFGTG